MFGILRHIIHVSHKLLEYESHIQCRIVTFIISFKILSYFTHLRSSVNGTLRIIPGDHLSRKDLNYVPIDYSSITSMGSSHVMVAELTQLAVHVHQLPSGERVRSLNYQELGLRVDDELYGVNLTGLLYLAVGNYRKTKSLHTFKVKYAWFF